MRSFSPLFAFATSLCLSLAASVALPQKLQSPSNTQNVPQRVLENGAELLTQAHQTFSTVQKIFGEALKKHQQVVTEEAPQLLSMLTIIVDEGMAQTTQIMTSVLSSLTSEMAFEELAPILENAIAHLRHIIRQTARLIETLVAPFDVVDRVIYISFRMSVDIEDEFKPLVDLIHGHDIN